MRKAGHSPAPPNIKVFRNPALRIENLPIVAGGTLLFTIGVMAMISIGSSAPLTIAAACFFGGLVFAPVYHVIDH